MDEIWDAEGIALALINQEIAHAKLFYERGRPSLKRRDVMVKLDDYENGYIEFDGLMEWLGVDVV